MAKATVGVRGDAAVSRKRRVGRLAGLVLGAETPGQAREALTAYAWLSLGCWV